jgi:hypothetical protein
MSEKFNLTLTIEQIYKELCPECKEKLLNLAAQSVAQDSLKEQIKKQWEDKK